MQVTQFYPSRTCTLASRTYSQDGKHYQNWVRTIICIHTRRSDMITQRIKIRQLNFSFAGISYTLMYVYINMHHDSLLYLCSYVHMWPCAHVINNCDQACKNQPSECKNHRFCSSLLYHNSITIYNTATKSSSLLYNLMDFHLKHMEMGYYILNERYW